MHGVLIVVADRQFAVVICAGTVNVGVVVQFAAPLAVTPVATPLEHCDGVAARAVAVAALPVVGAVSVVGNCAFVAVPLIWLKL
jgi:hypothetical protein